MSAFGCTAYNSALDRLGLPYIQLNDCFLCLAAIQRCAETLLPTVAAEEASERLLENFPDDA
jgi:hypothetical protein